MTPIPLAWVAFAAEPIHIDLLDGDPRTVLVIRASRRGGDAVARGRVVTSPVTVPPQTVVAAGSQTCVQSELADS